MTSAYLSALHQNPGGTEVISNALLWFFQTFFFSIPLFAGVLAGLFGMIFGIACRKSSSGGVRVTGILFAVLCPLLMIVCLLLFVYSVTVVL